MSQNLDGLRSPMSPGAVKSSAGALMSPGPKPTHLFLKKTLAGNGSSTSITDLPPPSTPSGLRAHLGHFLPRHSYFRAHVVIHQLASVPFVGGEFAVRWKFKGVQSTQVSKRRMLVKVKPQTENRDDDRLQDLRSPPEEGRGTNTDMNTSRPSIPISLSSTSSSRSSDTTDSQHLTTEWAHLAVSNTAASSASSLSTAVPHQNLSGSNTPTSLDVGNAPARGSTPFLSLKDHSVLWSQSLDTILKFDIDRETSHVLPHPLKLVVVQRINPGDPHGNPQNPQLGAVYLNLAEYVGQGGVTRRYLLKESKTNAILKLTIELEYLSGETHYIPPPLPKGEILNGIAGFLEKETVKKRPRALDLYGPYKNQEELETDLLSGLKSTARVPKTARSERKVSDSAFLPTETETEDDESRETTSFEETRDEVNVAFDVQRLPMAYGTKTTEMLIDCLFNPVRVSDKTEESPFTIYEPPPDETFPPRPPVTPRIGRDQAWPSNRRVGLGLTGMAHDPNATFVLPSRPQKGFTTEEESMHTTTTTTTTSDSASEHSHTSGSMHRRSIESGRVPVVNARSAPGGRIVVESHGHIGKASESSTLSGVRGWWKRNISRPNLAMTKNSHYAS